ncbi:NAD(P)/FAD-dependent oxidoreductase [Arsenophonus nasoniae]|uniref:NAD(P)/FAD-dependent oxidoreductase n=1 Tax=Arsenophonus nasoniae TaxID=638 RepID=A0AA95GSF8_9GAMM|nr:NAD(P)/FAD-dependent oxidoreductase [Arsenophonus nasoniae]WGM02074.1 NAD(P)/FAD-dependent oxidoreductase [Arsenophonus nasoniae]
MEKFDVIIIGAGAAGLFCAANVGQKGLKVLVLDNGKKAGRKILMSGGGRCNFTNLYIDPTAYISTNPHFCKSALARFTQWDFIALVQKHNIPYHEKILGQLFCDNSAQDIVDLLLIECKVAGVSLRFQSEITEIKKIDNKFLVYVNEKVISSNALIVASGGLSMPKLGATPFGYRIAEQFGHNIQPTRAALVPFTLHKTLLDVLQTLSGIAISVKVSSQNAMTFQENLLFTHRGLSGPAILQISSYWQPGEHISINLFPNINLIDYLTHEQTIHPNLLLKNLLAKYLPKRFIETLQILKKIPDKSLKQLNKSQINTIAEGLHNWQIQPNSTEGYRTAEVTLGGVDTNSISSKTMESEKVIGLYFIGEVVDVTGWLGGYNFQWAWSSAWACAQHLIKS